MGDVLIPASMFDRTFKLYKEWPALQNTIIIRAPGPCPVCSSPGSEVRGSCKLGAAAISP